MKYTEDHELMRLPSLRTLEPAFREAIQDEPWRIEDMLNAFGENQTKCKTWLMEHMPYRAKGVVLGGWYGWLASELGFKSVDIDPQCSKYGSILFPKVEFHNGDAFEAIMITKYHTIVCTSCEHMDQNDLDILNHLPHKPAICLQSNNWEGINGHINCKDSLEEFIADYYNVDIDYAGELDMGEYKRWMLIGRVL